MKGIEIARRLNISTSALRHYEGWGLIPQVNRAENGYRVYTNIHEGYFHTIRSLNSGFGMDFVRQVMPLVQDGKKVEVFWKIAQAQADLQKERETIQKTVALLDVEELNKFPAFQSKATFTIGEVAKEANVTTSAIRHWEKEGLIQPKRHKESRFRKYEKEDIRKIFLIRAVQRSAFFLESVREIMGQLENHQPNQVKEIVENSLFHLNERLEKQIAGIAQLHQLFQLIGENKEGLV